VDQLALALGNRAVLLVSSNDAAHAKAAAAQLGAALSASHAFASVTARVPPFDPGRITRFYLPHRFGLLTAEDRAGVGIAAGSAGTLRAALTERLYGLPGAGLTTSLADDPFGWLQHWLAGLPLAASNLTIEDGFLVSHEGSTTHVLVLGALPGSAYESDVQRNVLLAVASGETALKAAWPDVIVARTGAVFYAEAARRASERDVHVIGIVTAVGVALLMLWIFRSPRLILLGFVSTALGILCALAGTMLVFGKLHLLTLVFGASLIGEAVDYSIQYFVVYLGARHGWDSRRGAREVLPALTVALSTSLLGYAILTFAPFPALKQIACFAIVGIFTAFASVIWLLPTLMTRPLCGGGRLAREMANADRRPACVGRRVRAPDRGRSRLAAVAQRRRHSSADPARSGARGAGARGEPRSGGGQQRAVFRRARRDAGSGAATRRSARRETGCAQWHGQ